ncbi:PhnD/SsuA/transferrin family substrate-binding protein [Micromonospora lutea]|uniref:ABC transporter substrate-binding protein n=1 Tax=Micromonospora lutea TaxID=419825 RepID=A0ABQ4J2Z8_9ACTN|nr:PhnD/SsuA/transferrin family substrate-binding protein [Micromonospora lutea]GIJ24482.1 hypothetical protein Vlu01_51060 [Micromonospora lutea]
MRKTAACITVLALTAGGCSVAGAWGDDTTETVVVGYQSKTINTVTAGTLLRAQGYFEKRLAELGARTGRTYTVTWQDYDTGAPITAQMIAGKIDIGSMGDYPLLINGARGQQDAETRTQLISVTGYNVRGGLNSIVVAPDSHIRTLADLKGQTVSASIGSAGHGLLVQAARKAGLDPGKDFKTENQQPQVGATALESGSVAALSQFVAWPGLLVHQGRAQTRAAMQRLLIEVLSATSPTVVFVTHDVDEALLLGDRVAVLTPGGIRELIDVPAPRDLAARDAAEVATARTRILAALEAQPCRSRP